MEQLDLTAVLAREEAIGRVDDHANEAWKQAAMEAIKTCAFLHQEFTADEVWEVLQSEYPQYTTHEPAALGPRIRAAAKAGWIRKATGRMRSSSKFAQRHRELQIWESCL